MALEFVLVVVTNQRDVARGRRWSASRVEEVHAALRAVLPVLLEAARRHSIGFEGASWSGTAGVMLKPVAGAQTVWIECGYPELGPGVGPDCRVGSLAAGWIEAS